MAEKEAGRVANKLALEHDEVSPDRADEKV